jgi:hypothetical protein
MLRRPMRRRQFLSTGAAAMGGLIIPHGALAQDSDNQLPQATEAAPAESAPEESESQTQQPQPGGSGGIRLNEGLLPDHRLLFYYGFPQNELMGILGENEPEENLALMREQAAEYEAADSSRPWKLGFELIASVAQAEPQADNSYVADTDGRWLDLYTEFTAENDMVLLLDVQMGRREPKEDYEGLERWLQYDHVHLGIDPEFKMWDDEVPGQDLGHVTAAQVTEAQEWLVEIGNRYGTSRKMLLVHQFHVYMIQDKDQIRPVEGVDLVIHEDGWGPPEMKAETYNVIITQQPIEYHGFKLFYRQDEPLMTPDQVMALEPPPDVVTYQ